MDETNNETRKRFQALKEELDDEIDFQMNEIIAKHKKKLGKLKRLTDKRVVFTDRCSKSTACGKRKELCPKHAEEEKTRLAFVAIKERFTFDASFKKARMNVINNVVDRLAELIADEYDM